MERLLGWAGIVVLLVGCGLVQEPRGEDCHESLTPAECRRATALAEQFLASLDPSDHPNGGAPVRVSSVRKACSDLFGGCAEELGGFAFVRITNADDRNLGRVIVCVHDNVCGGEPTLMGFP